MMPRTAAILVGFLMLAHVAHAQTQPDGGSARATIFGAPGAAIGGFDAAILHLGAGGEFVWPSRVGVAGEVGYLFDPGDPAAGAVLLAPGVIYEFGAAGRVTPFVRGGFTVPLADASGSAVHAGFGMTRWFKRRGLRIEGRAHFPTEGSGRLLELRIGIVIR